MATVVCSGLTGFLLGSCKGKSLEYNPAMFPDGKFNVIRLYQRLKEVARIDPDCCVPIDPVPETDLQNDSFPNINLDNKSSNTYKVTSMN